MSNRGWEPTLWEHYCDGSNLCEAKVHDHGCRGDYGNAECDEPEEHQAVASFPRDVHEVNRRRDGADLVRRERIDKVAMYAFKSAFNAALVSAAVVAVFGITHLFGNPFTIKESIVSVGFGIVIAKILDFREWARR